MQAHQAWFDPIPEPAGDVPAGFQEWYDPERPESLDLSVAQFLKTGLTHLYQAINVDSTRGVTWATPWVQLITVLPWKREPLTDALREDVQRLMVENPAGPFDDLGATFTVFTRIQAIEYLTRYAGIVLQRPGTGSEEASALIMDRVLEQDFLLALAERRTTQKEFLGRLLSGFSIGLEDDGNAEPLLRDRRSRAHAKELNRLQMAFRPQLGVGGANMALAFRPTLVIPEQERVLSVFYFGLNLPDTIRREAEATRGRCFEEVLHERIETLIRWTSQIPPVGLLNRFRTSAETRFGQDIGQGASLRIEPSMIADLRVGLGLPSIEEKMGEVRASLNQIAMSKLTVSAIAAPSRPGKHAEGRREYRAFLEGRDRDLGLAKMFRAFRGESPWARSQPAEELDRLRATLERNKDHKKYWKEISDIRKQQASRKKARGKPRGTR